MHNHKKHNRGLTLVELLVGIAILGMLAGFAIPSFQRTVQRNQAATAANDLLSGLLLARSEAVKRERRVVVQRVGPWSRRWRAFTDDNRNGVLNPARGEVLLLDVVSELPGVRILGRGQLRARLVYLPSGRSLVTLRPARDYFEIRRGAAVRYLCFTPLGRPRIRREACS